MKKSVGFYIRNFNVCLLAFLSLIGLLFLSSSAFADQYGDFIYTVNANNTVTITGYTGAGGAVVIPAVIDGMPVVSIGDDAFYYIGSIASVIIPDSVLSVGDGAFFSCTGLTSMTIGNSVTSIGNGAFGYCSGLTSVTIPDSVTSIGLSAFRGCTGLTSITIPDSVTSIGNSTFEECTSLTNLTIPDGVTSIGDRAFLFCSSLISVTIGNSVASIGEQAFYGCDALTSIFVAASNTVYSSQDGVLYDKAKTLLIQFPGGKTGGFTIPDSVTSIGNFAFSDHSGLISVTMPDSVMSIGKYAFYYCTGLTSVTIGNTVTSIGNNAFDSCTGLTTVTIPASVISIGNFAFESCTSLTRAYFLGNAPSMGGEVFYGCSSNFTVCYTAGSTGFTTPSWYGYPAYPCAETASTTTSVQTTTTTIVPEEECSVSVISTILPLNAGLLPHVRRIVITGKNSNWDSTTAVSIDDIQILIPLRVQPTQINALIIVPSTIFGGFVPGEKAVGVATGDALCTGKVDIP